MHTPYLVTWKETATPRILTSLAELLEAEKNGELAIRPTNVIVNAPVVRWPTAIWPEQDRESMTMGSPPFTLADP